jgi:hypothetical protein
MRMMSLLLDPSPAPTRRPPNDPASWITAASASWFVPIDNLSAVTDWLSDALCRAVTGDADIRRRLYTNEDLTVISFRRVIMLNGIDIGNVRDDLADRLVVIQLKRIADGQRQRETELQALWKSSHPRLLGALLDLTVAVLGLLPSINVERQPRMADFARLLAGVDLVLGASGLETYRGLSVDLAEDAVEANPVLHAIIACIVDDDVVSSAELLARIAYDAPDRRTATWPRDAREMTGFLRRHAPALRHLGWTVNELPRGGHNRIIRWRLIPPLRAGENTEDD